MARTRGADAARERVTAIDLNADVGEGFGPYAMGADAELLSLVTSANVACGFHGGDPTVIDRTVALAARHRLAIGAHPGHYDLRGFGRRPIAVPPAEIERDVLYQVGALQAFARSHGIELAHVKPHGALYNQAATDEAMAEAAAQAVSIARDGRVKAADGRAVEVRAETLCLHGDNPAAVGNARAVRRALDAAGISVRSLRG